MTTRDTSTETNDRPAPTRRRRLPRLDLSATQLVATALAAITATFAASYLGVSGTVVGAAVASVLTAVGNAVYGHSLRSTRDRVREAVPAARFAPRPGSGVPTAPLPTVRAAGVDEAPPALPTPTARPRPVRVRPERTRSPWRRVAVGAVTVFATVLAVVTSIEVVAGRPISDLLRGDTGTGTTLFGGDNAAHAGPTTKSNTTPSAPTVTETVTPKVVVTTPTVTRTAAPTTRTTTPTTTAPSSSPAPSGSSGSSGETTDTGTPSHTLSP